MTTSSTRRWPTPLIATALGALLIVLLAAIALVGGQISIGPGAASSLTPSPVAIVSPGTPASALPMGSVPASAPASAIPTPDLTIGPQPTPSMQPGIRANAAR
jgi:hypothetical protein